MSQMATATPAVTMALATITVRQPSASTKRRSGAPASVAPMTPTKSATPLASANRRGGIQWLASLSMATKATPAAAPMASRPTFATAAVGARANMSVPTAVSAAPAVRSFLGPHRSAMSPVGICIAT